MFTLNQIAALSIFAGVFTVLIIGRVQRYIPALVGALLTITIVFLGIMRSPQAAARVLNFAGIGQPSFWVGHEPAMTHGVNWQTIFFIAGMMVIVEGLRAVGFFRWLCLSTARIVNYRIIPITLLFMLLSGVISMFVDNITVLLFMGSVTIELARLLKVDPVPLIIAEVFAANVGGTATLIGDPPNIIIGTSLGYTFTDFLANVGPIVWVGMAASLGYFYLRFRRERLSQGADTADALAKYPEPGEAIVNRNLFKVEVAIFVVTVALLVTQFQTGLTVAAVAFIGAGATFVASRKSAPVLIRGVDWRTLLFFFGLFVSAAGLEKTGLLQILADYIGRMSGGSEMLAVVIILWVSAFASAIVDNIPFTTIMVPVIVHLAQATGGAQSTLAWALALGACIGGNATPIGASANVVGIAITEKAGYRISWKRFLSLAFPPTMLVVAICHLMLVMRYVP